MPPKARELGLELRERGVAEAEKEAGLREEEATGRWRREAERELEKAKAEIYALQVQRRSTTVVQ